MFAKGQIGIVGGVYNIENGQVDFFKNLTTNGKEVKRYALATADEK
jgi:carbonic anhydrase